MNYLDFSVLVVPAVIGLVASLALGPNRGGIAGAIALLITVFTLLMFQVTPDTGRIGSAVGLMGFEWIRWAPAFLVGAAVGSIVYRVRRNEK